MKFVFFMVTVKYTSGLFTKFVALLLPSTVCYVEDKDVDECTYGKGCADTF